jgi:hypothetical protein
MVADWSLPVITLLLTAFVAVALAMFGLGVGVLLGSCHAPMSDSQSGNEPCTGCQCGAASESPPVQIT